MSKYHNIKKQCLSGHIHASKFEADYCNRLLAMQRAGEIQSYKIQVKIPLIVNGQKICDHIVDFLVVQNNGVAEVREAKGMATPVWKLKYKLFQALNLFPYKVIYKNQRRSRCKRRIRQAILKRIKVYH